MKMPTGVRVLRTLPEIEEIRPLWESWPGNRDSDIDSYLTFLRSNPMIVCPYIVVVDRGGRPDAMLVGRIERGRIHCKVGYFGLKLKADILYFVYGALRGNASLENCDLMVNQIMQFLRRGEADAAYLNFLRQDSHLWSLATKKPGLLSRDHVRITQPHFSATIPRDVEEFYQGLSPKVRKNQRWQAKKLISDFSGAVRIHCYREIGEVDQAIEVVERLARGSYQRGLGVGFVDSPEMRKRLRLKAEKGWLRAYVLYIGDRPGAFWIGDVNQTTLGSEFLGYDSDFGKYSPGMYLIMKVIEDLCDSSADHVTEVDFGTGWAQYKEVLGNRKWEEDSVYIFAPSLKGIRLNLAKSFIGAINRILKVVLKKAGLLQKIKKTWRGHVRQEQVKAT